MAYLAVDEQQNVPAGGVHGSPHFRVPEAVGVRFEAQLPEVLGLDAEYVAQHVLDLAALHIERLFAFPLLDFGAQPREFQELGRREENLVFLAPAATALHPHDGRGASLPLPLLGVGPRLIVQHRLDGGPGLIEQAVGGAGLGIWKIGHPVADVDERALPDAPDDGALGQRELVPGLCPFQRRLQVLDAIEVRASGHLGERRQSLDRRALGHESRMLVGHLAVNPVDQPVRPGFLFRRDRQQREHQRHGDFYQLGRGEVEPLLPSVIVHVRAGEPDVGGEQRNELGALGVGLRGRGLGKPAAASLSEGFPVPGLDRLPNLFLAGRVPEQLESVRTCERLPALPAPFDGRLRCE